MKPRTNGVNVELGVRVVSFCGFAKAASINASRGLKDITSAVSRVGMYIIVLWRRLAGFHVSMFTANTIQKNYNAPGPDISLVCSPAILGVLAGAGISQIREILPYDDSPGGIADLCLLKTSGILLAHITHLWARVDRGPCVDLRMFHDYSFKALLISVLSKSLSDPSSLLRVFRYIHGWENSVPQSVQVQHSCMI